MDRYSQTHTAGHRLRERDRGTYIVTGIRREGQSDMYTYADAET
jgi:hypothetical protein